MLKRFHLNIDPVGLSFSCLTYVFLLYAYYVLIGVVIIPLMNESIYGCLNGVLLTILIFLCIISHLKASLSNPGYVSILNNKYNDKPQISQEGYTTCSKCEIYRTADSHHCGICRKCIKKRHHHCPWINNCIGELNQKYFIQFNFYTSILCIYGIIFLMTSLIIYPDEIQTSNRISPSARVYHSVFVIVECIVFGLFVFAIMCEQITSITSSCVGQKSNHSETRKSCFDNLGENLKLKYFQFCQVFGQKNPILWLFPFDFRSNSNFKFQGNNFFSV
ncbi:unnamed protein product [Brachionus calyciflorus]|uniref:Palmitoyltransferase n=1 Tax=Brachionus calyciflorus TaxID=104777 RepID=A0A813M807_9BILA|nr:unnamed protein product [Brachionus calyciflorus]